MIKEMILLGLFSTASSFLHSIGTTKGFKLASLTLSMTNENIFHAPLNPTTFMKSSIKGSLSLISLVSLVSKPLLCSAYEQRSDEIEIEFLTDYIGLGLVETFYKKSRRLIVQSVKADSEASRNADIKAGMIVVSTVEGLSLQELADKIRSQPRPLKIVFRDPGLFFSRLDTSNSLSAKEDRVSTQVRPGNDYTSEVLKVERIERPELCSKSAVPGDVMEVSYQVGSVPAQEWLIIRKTTARLTDGAVVDGVKSMTDPGLFSSNIYFVLGGQPLEQFPPGWDLGLRGMCVGERRLVTLPPSLGFGSKGLKRRGIPPDATILYDVRLVSINGVAEIR